MPDHPADGGSFPENRYANPEAALGGADAVSKTTYVAGEGTEPESRPASGAPLARPSSSTGASTVWIVLAFFLVAAILVYVLGFGR